MVDNDAGAGLHNDVNTIDVISADGDRRDVQVIELSPQEWCVRDGGLAADDPAALLGFIQGVGGVFEVTNLRLVRVRSYFSSFGLAAASLGSRPVLAAAVR